MTGITPHIHRDTYYMSYVYARMQGLERLCAYIDTRMILSDMSDEYAMICLMYMHECMDWKHSTQ